MRGERKETEKYTQIDRHILTDKERHIEIDRGRWR